MCDTVCGKGLMCHRKETMKGNDRNVRGRLRVEITVQEFGGFVLLYFHPSC